MKFRFWVLTVVISCLAVGVQAQSLQKLKIPDEIVAELEGESLDFELSSPDKTIVELSFTSDEFDPYLEILDAEGNTIGENDDGGEGTGAFLSLIAEADAVYTVRARSYSSSASGDFTLTVSEQEFSEISIEESVSADLENKSQLFTFIGKEGDALDFVVDGEDYDTTLALLDAFGNTLVTSDDEMGLNPFISDFLIPNDGTYILKLSSYSDTPPESPVQIRIRPTTVQDLTFDKAITSDAEKSYLRFEAQAGVTYRVEVRADVPAILGIEIRLRTAEFIEFSSNSSKTNALIIEFTPTTDGVYKLTLSGTSADYESTSYSITITEVK
jgi:hypothetical protein